MAGLGSIGLSLEKKWTVLNIMTCIVFYYIHALNKLKNKLHVYDNITPPPSKKIIRKLRGKKRGGGRLQTYFKAVDGANRLTLSQVIILLINHSSMLNGNEELFIVQCV